MPKDPKEEPRPSWAEIRADRAAKRSNRYVTMGADAWRAGRKGHPVRRGRLARTSRGRLVFVETPTPSEKAKKIL
jgi:hypothetical protein